MANKNMTAEAKALKDARAKAHFKEVDWDCDSKEIRLNHNAREVCSRIHHNGHDLSKACDDFEFFALAANTADALCDRVIELEAQVQRMREALELIGDLHVTLEGCRQTAKDALVAAMEDEG